MMILFNLISIIQPYSNWFFPSIYSVQAEVEESANKFSLRQPDYSLEF